MLQLSLRIRDIPDAAPEDGARIEVALDRTFLRDALGNDVDVTRSAVSARLQVGRTDETVQVRGQLEGEVWTVCGRCLGEARVPVDLPLRIVLGSAALGAEDSSDEEIEYYTHDGATVELADAVRESLILAMPMKILCQPECSGLCPSCGASRGEDGRPTCDCPEKPIDPRWAALRDLKTS